MGFRLGIGTDLWVLDWVWAVFTTGLWSQFLFKFWLRFEYVKQLRRGHYNFLKWHFSLNHKIRFCLIKLNIWIQFKKHFVDNCSPS
jgi:hypothetical protein